MSSFTPTFDRATTERTEQIRENLIEIRQRVNAASTSSTTVAAVSKYKPASDILVCYENGQLDFGENYVQELVDKSKLLPNNIRWHFIGTLQSNKAKLLASIPNLHTVQTLSSEKTANALNKSLPEDRSAPLNVLIQINTSGEDSKSGVPPLSPGSSDAGELKQLAKHIVLNFPKLRLQGLMTIGALELSLNATETEKNADFERLKETRDVLSEWLVRELGDEAKDKWGDGGRLLLSMGMSSDFEAALKAGSDVVRVGTGIFGQRKTKDELEASVTSS